MKNSHGIWLFALTAVVANSGCTAKPIVEPTTYSGEPLAVIQGELRLPPSVAAPQSVRLALVWYRDFMEASPTNPNAITAQDVPYTGNFPANYTFNLYAPPPAAALTPVTKGTGNVAYAILVAYEDLNGNGKLDTIPQGGPSADKVLGTSASFFDLTTSYWFYYADGDVPSSWPAGTQTGLNLIYGGVELGKTVERVLPLSAAMVPLVLSGEAELSALICAASYLDGPVDDPNPLAYCGIPATPNVLRASISLYRFVDDSSTQTTVTDYISILLSDGEKWLKNATVTVNGTAVPLDGDHDYSLSDLTGSVLLPGTANTVSITAIPFAPISYQVMVPGEARLAVPSAGASVATNASTIFSWQAAANAELYMLSVRQQSPEARWSFRSKTATSASAPALHYSGPGDLYLWADGQPSYDRFGSYAFGYFTHHRQVTFTP